MLEPARLPEHFDRLWRAAYALCATRQDAEDLVQETYARVLRRPRSLRRAGELAYLLRVLRNTWYDTVSSSARQRAVATPVDELEFVVDPRADLDQLLDTRATYAAIAALSPPLREAIVAIDIVGLSYREAARAMRTREGTITSRLYRARLQVADALEAGS